MDFVYGWCEAANFIEQSNYIYCKNKRIVNIPSEGKLYYYIQNKNT